MFLKQIEERISKVKMLYKCFHFSCGFASENLKDLSYHIFLKHKIELDEINSILKFQQPSPNEYIENARVKTD